MEQEVEIVFKTDHPRTPGDYLLKRDDGRIEFMKVSEEDIEHDRKNRHWLDGRWCRIRIVDDYPCKCRRGFS